MIRFFVGFLLVYLWFKLHEGNLLTFLLVNHMFKLIVDWCNDRSYFTEILLIFEPPCMSKWNDPGIPVKVFGGHFGRLILICWGIPSMVCGYSQPCCDTCLLGPETNYISGHPKIAVHPNTMFNSTYVFAFGCFKDLQSHELLHVG